MFEDSLMESTGRIRTRSRYFAIGSFVLQAMLLVAMILYPILHPAKLPKQALTMFLTAPPVPSAPAHLQQPATAVSRAQPIMIANPLAAPIRIPQHAAMVAEPAPPGAMPSDFGQSGTGKSTGILDSLGTAAPPPVTVKPAVPKGPMRISSGVATGRLLAPIQPVYPAIARAAHITGTVVVQAIIAEDGSIRHIEVLSGPPMLRQAAIDAIAKARYRPFLLNDAPIEVETMINVVFSMN